MTDSRANPSEPQRPQSDGGALIDRLATRFAAFAVVGAVSWPVFNVAQGMRAIYRFELKNYVPGYSEGLFWFVNILGCTMILVTIALGVSVILPVMAHFKPHGGWAVLLVAPMSLGLVASLIVMFLVVMGNDTITLFGEAARGMERIEQICAPARLMGPECAGALGLEVADQATP